MEEKTSTVPKNSLGPLEKILFRHKYMDIYKLIEDNEDEKLKIADPAEIFPEIFARQLRLKGKQGIVKVTSQEFHSSYTEWAKQFNEQDYMYNIQSLMLRLRNLKINGVKTGLKNKYCSLCSFDTDILGHD